MSKLVAGRGSGCWGGGGGVGVGGISEPVAGRGARGGREVREATRNREGEGGWGGVGVMQATNASDICRSDTSRLLVFDNASNEQNSNMSELSSQWAHGSGATACNASVR